MGVPKRKTSKQRRNQRSSTRGIIPGPVMACLTCQAPVTPHQICKTCGYYKGRKIIQTKADRMQKRGDALRAKQAKVETSTQKAS